MVKSYIISQTNNSFAWLPMRCGTHTLTWILLHYDFENYFLDEDKLPNLQHKEDFTRFEHDLFFPPNHKELNFICSVRNPYDRVFSLFKMRHSPTTMILTKKVPNLSEFEKFVDEIYSGENNNLQNNTPKFDIRFPDFIIKTESMYEDLTKIPFIKDSQLNKCGILKKMCEKKIYSSNHIKTEDYLTPKIKEKIFQVFRRDFEVFGYKK